MYKSHGKEYLENNFSQEELDSLMRPPPGSNTSKPSPSPRKVDKDEIVIQGSPTGVLPISPPLTPKLSPRQRKSNDESPTLVPSSRIIPTAFPPKTSPQKIRPGPASLTKPQHYFDQEAQHSMVKCQLCETKFLRKSDLYIHMRDHGVTVLNCEMCEDRFLGLSDLKHHLSLVHGQTHHLKDEEPPRRRPGPASRTNAPKENRATPPTSSNLPSHLASQYPDSPGYPCSQCGKVLMHKQSYVSHMRVIHGDYYGGNKWRGSSVVQMVLGDQDGKALRKDEKTHPNPALHNITNHPEENSPSYNDYKFGLACEFCNKAFGDQTSLDDHIQSKHPYLTKRIQAFKEALGLKDSEEPDKKRLKLDYEGIVKNQNVNSLSSYSILSFSDAHAHLSANGYDEPLDLACKPVSVSVHEEEDRGAHHLYHSSSHNGNNLLQVVRPCPSPPSSPLNLHISRPATPSPSPDPPRPNHDTHGAGHQGEVPTRPTHQGEDPNTPPRMHEYLVKQSNATADESGRKKFLCPVCKCQLSWKTNLSVHLRTHSGERPFQCVLCLNRFRQKAHLYKHFRCSHGHKVAPYNCSFCPETFTRSPNDLYNHITEVHKQQTDQLQNNNNNNTTSSNNNHSLKEPMQVETEQEPLSLVLPSVLTPPSESERSPDQSDSVVSDDEEIDVEGHDDDDEDEDDHVVRDRDDDIRFEPITEEFLYENEMIRPSYCVLPFVTDEEVERCTQRDIAVSRD